MLDQFNKLLDKPVSNTPLLVFRIIFGALLFLEAGGAIATGWVRNVFVEPDFHFTFIGFEWLRFMHGEWMYAYFSLMALAGLGVALGWRYRMSITIYAIMWTGAFLAQKTHYNNHYYLVVILCWIMVFTPAHLGMSLDVKQGRAKEVLLMRSGLRWLFVFEMTVVYVYGAIAKIYPDWLQSIPVEIWFEIKSKMPLMGWFFEIPGIAVFVSYMAILFDAFVAPLMLWSKTRKVAFVASLVFHIFNAIVFQIGIFPFLSISFALFYFPPANINKLFARFRAHNEGAEVTKSKRFSYIFILITLPQLLIPLRHWFIPGNVLWTEEGHRMSWRMMLKSKSGRIYFHIKDLNTGLEIPFNARDYLSKDQMSTMATHPDFIWQFTQFIKETLHAKGYHEPDIRIKSFVSVNGRKYELLTDRNVNMANVEWNRFGHNDWLSDHSEIK